MSNNASMRNIPAMLVFARVVEEGSFTAAAKQLGLSKASVSREVSGLEERLGAQLLRRTTRRMSLTEVGDVFYAHCLRVSEAAETAEHSVSELRAEPQGLIRVAAPMSFGHLQVAPRISRLTERHPELQVELELTDRVIDLVHERIDLAIRIRRPRAGSMVLRRLCPIRGILAASASYLERAGTPRTPYDLTQHNCLRYHSRSATWGFVGGETVEVSGNFSADNGDALRHGALRGLGVVYLPSYVIADDVREGRLVPILTEFLHPGSALYAVYPESRHLSPKVRAMIDWLADEFGAKPAWDADLFT